jgi:AraC-like DNA-binding protein
MSDNDEFARYRAAAGRRGIDVLNARFVTHQYSPHAHDTWAIAGVLSGMKDNAAPGSSNLVREGELAILAPGFAHAGKAIDNQPYQYVMIYVPDNVLQERAQLCGIESVGFSNVAIPAAEMVSKLASFVRATLESPFGVPASQEMTTVAEGFLDELIICHGRIASGREDTGPSSPEAGLVRAQQFLVEHWDQPISLGHLAREAAMSPYHFCRQFGRLYGLTPHRYQQVMRLTKARGMIVGGASLAEAAAATGFADQSHLGRQFKSCFGYSPGSLTGGKSISIAAQKRSRQAAA